MSTAYLPLAAQSFVAQMTPVGSRVTCVPAPTDTDEDHLVRLVECAGTAFEIALLAEGWTLGGSLNTSADNNLPPEARFWSYTKDQVNLIVTESLVFEARFLAATHVAKRLNLLSKEDRIALFQAVLYANIVGPV